MVDIFARLEKNAGGEIIQTRFPHQIAVEVNDTLMSANGDSTALTEEEISSVREQINNYLEEQLSLIHI